MGAIRALIQQMKALELEYLNEQELDALKEEIIKLLVDIQMQKDINQKIQQSHLTMEDVQIQVMQQSGVHVEDGHIEEGNIEDGQKESLKKDVQATGVGGSVDISVNEVLYKAIIDEKISEDLISIYTKTDSDTKTDSKEYKEKGVREGIETSLEERAGSVAKICFSINDKFRIVKKLFQNNSKEFEYFIERLNGISRCEEAERWIEENAAIWGWDKKIAEYQILVKQNLRRFRRL